MIRKRAALALMTRLGREAGFACPNDAPYAAALAWALNRLASGRDFRQIGEELEAEFGADWLGPGSSTGAWRPTRHWLSGIINRLNVTTGRGDASNHAAVKEARWVAAAPLIAEAHRLLDDPRTGRSMARLVLRCTRERQEQKKVSRAT